MKIKIGDKVRIRNTYPGIEGIVTGQTEDGIITIQYPDARPDRLYIFPLDMVEVIDASD